MTEKSEIIKLYKNLGETPLDSIYRFKDSKPEYREVKMTYLGRLDPMAEGLLLILVGNTKNKLKYLDFDKTYEFEILWGFESDTYDVLGKIKNTLKTPTKLEAQMPALLRKIQSKKTQEYPPYSSKTVLGKPLFMWARENRVDEIEIPGRNIKIFSIEHIHTRYISTKEVMDQVSKKISLVKGDFRQKEALLSWQQALKKVQHDLLLSKFKADVSTGTYIRGLANDMGGILNCGGLAYSIKRTRVGDYLVD